MVECFNFEALNDLMTFERIAQAGEWLMYPTNAGRLHGFNALGIKFDTPIQAYSFWFNTPAKKHARNPLAKSALGSPALIAPQPHLQNPQSLLSAHQPDCITNAYLRQCR